MRVQWFSLFWRVSCSHSCQTWRKSMLGIFERSSGVSFRSIFGGAVLAVILGITLYTQNAVITVLVELRQVSDGISEFREIVEKFRRHESTNLKLVSNNDKPDQKISNTSPKITRERKATTIFNETSIRSDLKISGDNPAFEWFCLEKHEHKNLHGSNGFGDLFREEKEGIYPIYNGQYMPEKTVPASSIAIIVPFRNREKHLLYFLNIMPKVLIAQKLHFKIYVVNQVDGHKFNRGALLNVGVQEAMKDFNWDCYYSVFENV